MGRKPEYHLSWNVHEGILEITIKGEMEINTVEKLQNEVFDVEKSSNTSAVLIDVCGIKGRFGLTEAYFRVRNYPPEQWRLDVAVVDLEENEPFQSFHQITANNVGLSLKCFTDIDAARAWLISRQQKRGDHPAATDKTETRQQYR